MTKTLNQKKIEVYITDVDSNLQVGLLQKQLEKRFPTLEIRFDLNETDLLYPCGHTILRVSGNKINGDKIISMLIQAGFKCDVLEDKVCK
jgi:hypothetical protein